MTTEKFIFPGHPPQIRFITVLCFLLLWIGCGDPATEKKSDLAEKPSAALFEQPGGIYRAPLMQIPSTLDPAFVQDQYGVLVVRQLFDGLVQFGPYLTVLPALADSWQVDDGGRRIRFIIRQGARFHNGRIVTAEDARYSLARLLRIEPPTAILAHLLKIEGALEYRKGESQKVSGLNCPGENELHIRLTEPHAPFLSALAMYQASIVPAEKVDPAQDRFEKKPVGTGPFSFVAWEENRMIRLQRFDPYFAGKAFLDEIRFRLYPGARIDNVLSDFKNGELEEMPFYFGIRDKLSDERAYRRFHRPSLSLLYYGVNTRHPLLQRPEFRKALSLAIDRSALVRTVYNDQFEAAHSILPPGMPAYQRLEDLTRFDPAAAEKIAQGLADPSLPGSLTLEIACSSTSDFARKELEFVRNTWRPLGITVEPKFITDWTEFERYLQSDSVQLYRYVWNADLPDPDSFLHPLFSKASPVNFGGFADDRTDRMLTEALAIVDPVSRAEKYHEIERYILNQYPLIPMFYLSIDRVYQPYVQGVHISALGAHTMSLNRVWLKREPGITSSD